MSLSREDAAQKLGMKVEEIVGVAEEGGKTLVTTHDGVVTEVDGDQLTTRMPDGDVAVAEATDDGPELVDAPGTDPGVVVEALAQAPAGQERADTPPRDPRLDGDIAGAFDDSDGGNRVPDGTNEVVLNWVGNDRDRARRAYEHEQKRERPRSTLVAALEKLKG